VFIANALFVPNARPDVEATWSTYPMASRAGWGYLLLTYGLWDQGNGSFTLHAFAYDQDDHVTTLGTKTILVDNAHALRPFGTIDTPGYGSAVSGAFWNYGWALTPGSSCALANGSVQVSVDSGPLRPVTHGDPRPDIAAAFPAFTDGQNGGGHFYLDTTALTNGMHQIGWLVTDDCGRQDGVGSRFFTVLNGAGDARAVAAAPVRATAGRSLVASVAGTETTTARRGDIGREPVTLRQLGGEWAQVPTTPDGTYVVEVAQSGHMELRLPRSGGSYAGHSLVAGVRRALPLGSSLDVSEGIFYWQPAPGFLGTYELAFVTSTTPATRVRVVVGPPMRASIDAPAAGEVVTAPFWVAGWALDLASDRGPGIDTVHVWAYPAIGTAPIFLGVAVVGDPRQDVARLYGAQFERSAFGLSVDTLDEGSYDIVAYPHRARANIFDGAQVVRVTVR
jgi:hypothetical protein